MSKWTDKLTVADMPEQYQQLARTIGVQNLLKLADEFGGDKPYIPKREALLRIARDRLIRKQYTGYNAKELARYYDLTERWVLKICRGCEGAEEDPEPEVVSHGDDLPPQQFSIFKCF